MKHILFVTMQYGEGYNQGTEKYIKNLCDELSKSDYKISILSTDPKNIQGKISNKLKDKGWTQVTSDIDPHLTSYIGKNNIDLIHLVHPGHIGLGVVEYAKKINIPIVITVTDYWWVCPKNTLITPSGSFCEGNKDVQTCIKCIASSSGNETFNKLSTLPLVNKLLSLALSIKLQRNGQYKYWKNRPKITQSTLSAADAVITLSDTSLRLFRDKLKLKNLAYIPTGLNPMWLEKKQVSAVKKGVRKVGFLGAIERHKGLHILLKAISKLHGIELYIAGPYSDKVYKKELDSYIKKENLFVTWLGKLTESQAIKFIDSINLLTVPSISPENQPQVILEALSRNTPVVCSDVSGAAELVHRKYTYSMHNSFELADLLIKTLESNEPYEKVCQLFSTHDQAEKVIHIYNKVLQK
ncbi:MULTISPECIES: glycosyltransferase [Pseudoalteromonas]|uniref:glycosyltransferase n=1 Tax=Pseudoalteromonas TaxID=53246 RepID=UPI0015839493|nr:MULTISPECIES: glycosyltransferase [Pseudoalteromonas]MDI4652854.1 glycosyltransferase [Pseudoalteromonas shioyasakiensis]NUJ39643.1 glycosyltransferase [Pseudoalteromonas sp. 0303]